MYASAAALLGCGYTTGTLYLNGGVALEAHRGGVEDEGEKGGRRGPGPGSGVWYAYAVVSDGVVASSLSPSAENIQGPEHDSV